MDIIDFTSNTIKTEDISLKECPFCKNTDLFMYSEACFSYYQDKYSQGIRYWVGCYNCNFSVTFIDSSTLQGISEQEAKQVAIDKWNGNIKQNKKSKRIVINDN